MKQARNTRRRHIPAELAEEILLNLPVKSLLRFSTVSESWKSTILGGEFAARYRGREMMALKLYASGGGGNNKNNKYVVCPGSALSGAAPPLSLPFVANWDTGVSCGALRCVAAGTTLWLYNPSTRAHRRLPPRGVRAVHAYGLGYDSAGGDYKVFKSHHKLMCGEAELYSLRSDSWRAVSDSRRKVLRCLESVGHRIDLRFLTRKGVFFNGSLRWAVFHSRLGGRRNVDILTFDVTTESYGKVAVMPPLPESYLWNVGESNPVHVLDVCELRGRLALWLDHIGRSLVVWVMEEDGTWKKDMTIDYTNIQPLCFSSLKPLYFYDANGNVVKAVTTPVDVRKLFIYKEKEDGSFSLVEKSFSREGYGVLATFTYFESLVSPFSSFQ